MAWRLRPSRILNAELAEHAKKIFLFLLNAIPFKDSSQRVCI